jgi:hypothetical protein
MLIVLDDSLLQALNDENKRDMAIEVIQDIASAYSKGTHFLYASYRVLDSLRKNPLLSKVNRAIYGKLYEKFPQLGSLLLLPFYLRIIADGTRITRSENGNTSIVQVPINILNRTRLFGSLPIFLTEDLEDEKFYYKIARNYLIRSKLGNLHLAYFPRGGGGNRIWKEYQNYQGKMEFLCLCIVDSDKKFPTDHYGDTAQKLLDILDINYYLTEALFLNEREIENLLPFSLLSQVINNDREKGKSIMFLEKVRDILPEAVFFLDIKEGLTIREVINVAQSAYGQYWKKCLLSIGEQRECIKGNHCPESADCDDCKIMPGFGGNVLRDSVDSLERISDHKFNEMAQDLVDERYMRLGRVIVSWFCAPPDISVAI